MCEHHLVLATTSQLELLFVRLQTHFKLMVSGFWTVTGTMQLQRLSKIWTKILRIHYRSEDSVGTAAKQRPIYFLHCSKDAEIDMDLRHMWFW